MNPPVFVIFLLIALGGLGLYGVWLVFTGIRGRAVDAHPRCRRCGFDLTGVYFPGVEGLRCPECGKALAPAEKAITTTYRTRRPRRIVVGLVVLAAPVVLATGVLSKQITVPSILAKLPTGVVASITSMRISVAARELVSRVQAEPLAQADVNAAIAAALAVQADLTTPWDPVWGTLVETARAKGLVTDAQWTAYARSIAAVNVRTRDVVSSGSYFPVELTSPPARVGSGSALRLLIRCGVPAPVGSTIPLGGGFTTSTVTPNMASSSTSGYRLALAPGEHEIEIPTEVSVVEGNGNTPIPGTAVAQVYRRKVTMIEDPSIIVKSVANPALLPFLMSAASVTDLALAPDGDQQKLTGVANLRTPAGMPITDVAFTVFLRTPPSASSPQGGLIRLGTIACTLRQAGDGCGSMFSATIPVGLSPPFDFLLRSDPEAALGRIDMNQIWEGELPIDAVPLGRVAPR